MNYQQESFNLNLVQDAIEQVSIFDNDTLQQQIKYVEEQERSGNPIAVVFQEAFIAGMREIGYKSPSWAIAEVVDNAVQAEATKFEVKFGYKGKSNSVVEQIALIDDGLGMYAKMISYAVRWGGTHRHNNRDGFGRFGYGLPSASVSMAKKYTVYSKVAGEHWYSVTVDLSELASVANDMDATVELLQPKLAELPAWVTSEGSNSIDVKNLESGTIVVLEELDKLHTVVGWKTKKAIKAKLLEDFGTIFKNTLIDCKIIVDGMECEPIDPLFIMENARFFSETSALSHNLGVHSFEVETESGNKGWIKITSSVLPPNFSWKDPNQEPLGTRVSEGRSNRFGIMKRYDGIKICRDGRLIDVITPNWTKWQNYDTYLQIEIDFDPVLDEYFGVTTSKQQIVLSETIDQKLKSRGENAGGLTDLIKHMRKYFASLKNKSDAEMESALTKMQSLRASGRAMNETKHLKRRKKQLTQRQKKVAEENLKKEVEKRQRDTGRNQSELVEELRKETEEKPYEVVFVSYPEGPFYRPTRIGNQVRLEINTEHNFYTKLYKDGDFKMKSALEVLLLVLAESELDSDPETDIYHFYEVERPQWSLRAQKAFEKINVGL